MAKESRRYLTNLEDLINHGDCELRKMALDILEYALQAADPFAAVMRLIKLDGDVLWIGEDRFDLTNFERILVLGAGKASLPIAQAIETILGDRISQGLIILKHGERANLQTIQVIYGAHPVPDEGGFRGAKEIMKMVESLSERDLVICGITGGSSALMPYPVSGVTLEDKQEVNRVLLNSGADIVQINTVRKHLSQIKGGWLAKKIHPATLINLTVSDVVGDPLDYITGPTVPDTSTFGDARKVLDDFALWDKLPLSACAYLRNGGPEQETPKNFYDAPHYSYIVVNSATAAEGAAERATSLGFSMLIITTMLKGEAKDAGMLFAAIAKEIIAFGRPLIPPCVIIAAGENTVTIDGECGEGGPNQEFVASACLDIAGLEKIVIVSIDTDGADGPTKFTGGIVDGATLGLAKRIGLNVQKSLRCHNVTPLFDQLNAGIITGPTHTNVNDLKLLLVGNRS